MMFKSIEHTIDVHYQGVMRSIQQYKIPADARRAVLIDLLATNSVNDDFIVQLETLLQSVGSSNNISQYLSANIELSEFIAINIHHLFLEDDRLVGIRNLQEQLIIEQTIYGAHAQAFNKLIKTYPYSFLSNDETPFLMIDTVGKGLIIER